MEIKRGDNKYYIGDSEDDTLAEITYITTGNHLIIIDGTYVSAELNGKGIGKLLLKKVIGWARSENKKIIPLCPYAKAQMEKNEEYHDMIHS